jgi:hypothetical protein
MCVAPVGLNQGTYAPLPAQLAALLLLLLLLLVVVLIMLLHF